MVAVVREIVRTISAAENAISVLATIPNLDLFIVCPFPLWCFVSSHRPHGACRLATRVDDVVSRCLRLWFWEAIGSYCRVRTGQRRWYVINYLVGTVQAFTHSHGTTRRFISRLRRRGIAKSLLTAEVLFSLRTQWCVDPKAVNLTIRS